ncbi:MAG: DUF3536 domain-containing protein [Gemmatimonadetes bacterium]|nr:DUF3536 domain-containing protein [Gemmatimonadota bacterium]
MTDSASPALRRIVIHGHFCQPPREDPWLEEIPRAPRAAPWHDFHERIERECYRPVVSARVLNPEGKIARIVNLTAHMSFNVAPTLLDWLEHHAPTTYRAMLDGDRQAVQRTGHGTAIAHPYHHVILPLATRRDKVTEVRWGIADFRRRFGRAPEGMWLPETAVDDETLDVLAQEGIRFTVLAPNQVRTVPANGLPGRYVTTGGRGIAIFVYDGTRSHNVSFGPLLANARVWKADLLEGQQAQTTPQVITVATVGETFGHHHRFSEMALAWVVQELKATPDVALSSFAEVLAAHPPAETIALVGPSSWSCPHGVGRWRTDCGCREDAAKAPDQSWREPLRRGLESLRDALHERYLAEATPLFLDPWAARDAYGAVVAAPAAERDALVATLLAPGLSSVQVIRARELLEMMRDALRMFTSSAWFYDDIGRSMTTQALRYAARAIELAGDDAMERALRRALREALSNDPALGTGEDIWAQQIWPSVSPLVRVAGGLAAAQAFVPGWKEPDTRAFDVDVNAARVLLVHRRTGRKHVFDVSVQRRGVADAQAFVHPRPDLDESADAGRLAGTVPVLLQDFPEREREAVLHGVRAARQRELAQRLFGETRLAAMALGAPGLVDSAVAELDAEVRSIGERDAAAHVARASDLVDLLELSGHHLPYEVQSHFARRVRALAPEARGPFTGLAIRLGFAEEFLAEWVTWS